ncbi:MAG: hypothetical protein IPJ19_19800 [Planctomycetes bacterium]|nr:hypothetical protein [Planctomycetota bacterium]
MKLYAALLALCSACAQPAPAQKPTCVRLLVDDQEAAFHDPQVLSVDDANEHYEITLGGKPAIETDHPQGIALVLGSLRLAAQSWGRSGDEGSFTFPATPEQAHAFATALGSVARKREPFRGELRAKLEPVGELVAGAEQLPLRFTLTNTGTQALWFMDGGRGRNELGRDNRFTFEIERERESVATRELVDFGGLGSYRRLAPGESHVLELDLAYWSRLERAGNYLVRATYDADVMPGSFEPGKALPLGWHTHLRRTRRVPAELALRLR